MGKLARCLLPARVRKKGAYVSHQRRNEERAQHEEHVRMFVHPEERGDETYTKEDTEEVM